MSRLIKFRAWDVIFDEMMTWDQFKSSGMNWNALDDQNIVKVMQFTGMVDSDGVEIYEGDILEWHLPDLGRPEPDATIKFISDISFRRGCYEVGGYFLNVPRITKVIGNIYENADLLKSDSEKNEPNKEVDDELRH